MTYRSGTLAVLPFLCMGLLPTVSQADAEGIRTVIRSETVMESVIQPGSDAFEMLRDQQEPMLREYFESIRPSLWRKGGNKSAAVLSAGIFEGSGPILVRYTTSGTVPLQAAESKTHPETPELPPGMRYPTNPEPGSKLTYSSCGSHGLAPSQSTWIVQYAIIDADGDGDTEGTWIVISFKTEYVTECPPDFPG